MSFLNSIKETTQSISGAIYDKIEHASQTNDHDIPAAQEEDSANFMSIEVGPNTGQTVRYRGIEDLFAKSKAAQTKNGSPSDSIEDNKVIRALVFSMGAFVGVTLSPIFNSSINP